MIHAMRHVSGLRARRIPKPVLNLHYPQVSREVPRDVLLHDVSSVAMPSSALEKSGGDVSVEFTGVKAVQGLKEAELRFYESEVQVTREERMKGFQLKGFVPTPNYVTLTDLQMILKLLRKQPKAVAAYSQLLGFDRRMHELDIPHPQVEKAEQATPSTLGFFFPFMWSACLVGEIGRVPSPLTIGVGLLAARGIKAAANAGHIARAEYTGLGTVTVDESKWHKLTFNECRTVGMVAMTLSTGLLATIVTPSYSALSLPLVGAIAYLQPQYGLLAAPFGAVVGALTGPYSSFVDPWRVIVVQASSLVGSAAVHHVFHDRGHNPYMLLGGVASLLASGVVANMHNSFFMMFPFASIALCMRAVNNYHRSSDYGSGRRGFTPYDRFASFKSQQAMFGGLLLGFMIAGRWMSTQKGIITRSVTSVSVVEEAQESTSSVSLDRIKSLLMKKWSERKTGRQFGDSLTIDSR